MMRRRLGGPLYAGELLASPLLWFTAAMAAPSGDARLAGLVLLGLRWGIELLVDAPRPGALSWRDAAVLPLRDLLAAAVFWAGLLGRVVAWRGRPLVIGKETRICVRRAGVDRAHYNDSRNGLESPPGQAVEQVLLGVERRFAGPGWRRT